MKAPITTSKNNTKRVLSSFFLVTVLFSSTIPSLALALDSRTEDPLETSCETFQIHESISPKSRSLLKKDLRFLAQLPLEDHNLELQEFFDIGSTSTKEMTCWLHARAKIFVGDSLQATQLIQDSDRADFKFPNANLPLLTDTFEGIVNSGLLASNIGALGYLKGKIEGKLKSILVPGIGILEFKSARLGLIRLSETLFAPQKSATASDDNTDNPGHSITRVSALFHEARHSDGNHESLSFLHNVCPRHHDFAGKYACDLNLNGPYTIGASTTKHLLKSCKTCKSSELEALRLDALNSFSRVIRLAKRIRELNDEEKKRCQEKNRPTIALPEYCSEFITAKKWDAKPEL